MREEQLIQIEGIGEKVAHAVVHYFAQEVNRMEINALLNAGVKPQIKQVVHFSGHPFESKHFVLTGTLEHYTRSGAASLIKERGGKVIDSVSKKTDFLLVGHDPGSKLAKAQQLGIRILNENEFIEML